MMDGYGFAGPDCCSYGGFGAAGSGMIMELVLATTCVDGRVKAKLTGGWVLVPSWIRSVALTVPPAGPLAAKLKGRPTARPLGNRMP